MSEKRQPRRNQQQQSQAYISQVLDDAAASDFGEEIPTDEPPVYPGIARIVTTAAQHPPSTWISLPNVDFYKYRVPNGSVSKDQTTVTVKSPELYTDPEALMKFINEQAALPPRPAIRIRCGHSSDYHCVFDITINIMTHVVHPQGQQWNYLTVNPSGEQPFLKNYASSSKNTSTEIGPAGWARLFCEDPSEKKQLILERKVVNWDTEYIEGQIRNMIANNNNNQLNHLNQPIEVTFPTLYSKVVISKEKPKVEKTSANFDMKAVISGFKSLFDVKPTQNYQMLESIWPYASSPPNSMNRECVVETEQAWWHAWKVPILNAIQSKRRGHVTIEDRIEAAMGFVAPSGNQNPFSVPVAKPGSSTPTIFQQ